MKLVAILALLVACALAGCTNAQPIDDVTRFVELADNEHFDWTWTATGTNNKLHVDINHHQGPAVDLYLLNDEQYAQYQAGAEPSGFLDHCTKFGIKDTEYTCSVTPGNWTLVIDNTPRGPTEPTVFNRNYEADIKLVATHHAEATQ